MKMQDDHNTQHQMEDWQSKSNIQSNKKGGHIVQKILQEKTYDYIVTLWDQVLSECRQTCSARKGAALAVSLPPTLCADFTHPVKEDAIREHSTRYKQNQ